MRPHSRGHGQASSQSVAQSTGQQLPYTPDRRIDTCHRPQLHSAESLAQRELLPQLALNCFPVTTLQDPVEAAFRARSIVEQRSSAISVHFDIDVIDSGDCPRFNGGFQREQAMECLSAFLASPRLRAFTVAEANPDHDPEGRLIPQLVEGVVASFAVALQSTAR